MGPRALLLSPDDQAVNAITGVLEEMSVVCERPLDGASAAKKLNSERFDLVLVDCDNLPAAKLIFDVCRRSGVASVPVAIVDGRVGLPTAFRLGAELILTKPVAKDQARITVRTAVSRIKKEHPADSMAAPGAETASLEQAELAQPKAMAQAAGVDFSATTVSTPEIATVETSVPSADVQVPEAPGTDTPAATMPMSSCPPVATLSSAPALGPVAYPGEAKPATVAVIESPAAVSEPVISPATDAPEATAGPISEITDNNVVASAEAETEPPPKSSAESVPAEPAAAQPATEDPIVKALEEEEPSLPAPIFSSYGSPKPTSGRGLLYAAVLVVLVAGGFYAAWMYQPGFRELLKARLSAANDVIGQRMHRSVAPVQKPAAPVAVPVSANDPEQIAPLPAPPAAGNVPPSSSALPNAAGQPVSSAGASVPASDAAVTPLPQTQNSEQKSETKKASNTLTPAEGTQSQDLVILSSKGAEKRLLHRVAPNVPTAAGARSAEATVVLKTLVDETGAVKSVQPVEGDAVLADAAGKAVKQWRYKPFTRDGKALPFQTIVIVDFQ